MKIIKKEWKGMFTLEATFLVSIILCIQIILIYLSFYLYDRALVTGCAYQAALEGARIYDMGNEDIEEYVLERATKLVEGRLFACEYEVDAQVSYTKVSVTYEIHVNAPFGSFLESMLTNFEMDFSITKDSSKLSGVGFIQTCQQLNRLLNDRGEGKKEKCIK